MIENKNYKFEPKRFENKKVNRYTYNKGMSKYTYRVLGTLIWLAFIFGLVVVLDSVAPLWLLILWLLFVA